MLQKLLVNNFLTKVFCHFGPFLPFEPPNNPKNQNFEKNKKKKKKCWETLSFHTCRPQMTFYTCLHITLHVCTKNFNYMMEGS